MLFSQCDTEHCGLVDVDMLVDYIRSVQIGQTNSEELYDSQIDVSTLTCVNILMYCTVTVGNQTSVQSSCA